MLGAHDFHHLTALLIERGPITIMPIDNHRDWPRLAPRSHRGSWVNQTLRLRGWQGSSRLERTARI
jgi:hypothetical protein